MASASRYVPEQRDSIRFIHKKGQLYNKLSLKLPDLVRAAAADVVADVLVQRSLKPGDSALGSSQRWDAAMKFEDNAFRNSFGRQSGPQEARFPYEEANSPQACSAAVPILAAQLFLGIFPDAPHNRCYFTVASRLASGTRIEQNLDRAGRNEHQNQASGKQNDDRACRG